MSLIEFLNDPFRPDVRYLHLMERLYTVIQSFNAKLADGEAREFKPGEVLWCDLEQSGDLLKLGIDAPFEWSVKRQTFERCCVLMRATSTKPS